MNDYSVDFLAFTIRCLLIGYSVYHDAHFTVSYTDVDYRVFSDAARYLLAGKSPYKRATYRYTPLVALLVLPNHLLHATFGKVLFACVDILTGWLIRAIVRSSVEEYRKKYDINRQLSSTKIGSMAALYWLYNPLVIAISTRGNCDAIAICAILFTLYLLQQKRYFYAGLTHGFAVHFRLFPVIYSLAYYMYASDGIKPRQLMPTWRHLKFVIASAITFCSFTLFFYILYGYEFLYEAYLYHALRKDIRHNFSLYFYLLYLSADITDGTVWLPLFIHLPKLVLLLVLSVRYSRNQFTLNFCVLLLTSVFVMYNTVVTSQYFVWMVGVVPVCAWQLDAISRRALLLGAGLWFVGQLAWLLPAYLLEFYGWNTFRYIWIQCMVLFSVHVAIVGHLIQAFAQFEATTNLRHPNGKG